jgi:predicted RNase H-like HicB family nuclease
MGLEDYKVVLYRNHPEGWVAEVPAIPGCFALMPTRDSALAELSAVFQMISEEYAERNQPLPADTTEIVHAERASRARATRPRSPDSVRIQLG